MEIKTLREWRTDRGLSIRDLSKLSKVATGTIMTAENGQREPTLRVWRQLCAALDIKPLQVAEIRRGVEVD